MQDLGHLGGGAVMTDFAPIAVQAEGEQVLPADPTQIAVPSGQAITLQDVVWNAPGPAGLTLRFRFVAPGIAKGGAVSFEAASADMEWLCQNYAVPRIANLGPQPAQIVISLSDRPLPFGESAPDATQFFEAYSFTDGQCVWDMF